MDQSKVLERLRAAVLLAGSQTAFAAQNSLSTGYVSDVLAGRREPGAKILRALGVERRVVYQRRT